MSESTTDLTAGNPESIPQSLQKRFQSSIKRALQTTLQSALRFHIRVVHTITPECIQSRLKVYYTAHCWEISRFFGVTPQVNPESNSQSLLKRIQSALQIILWTHSHGQPTAPPEVNPEFTLEVSPDYSQSPLRIHV